MIPEELKICKNWVVWKAIKKQGQEKFVKMPFITDGQLADTTKPDTWITYDDAVKTYKDSYFSGIGFVFSEHDSFVGIDIDDCINEHGVIDQEVIEIIKKFSSYTEVSQSKRGLHIIIRGKKNGDKCRKGQFEVYDNNRYFALTGIQISNTPSTIEYRQSELNKFYSEVFKEAEKVVVNKPIQINIVDFDDRKIIEIASKASNGSMFLSLYGGNLNYHGGDHSKADLALCKLIAFYSQNFHQIDRIFCSSGLYRDKWNREYYKTKTINLAIDSLSSTYDKNYKSKRG